MKKIIFYILLIFTLVNLSGCAKSIEEPTGYLTVNARDGVGASIVGTTVYLYDNQYDFNNSLFSETLVTDNSGQVRFEYLTPGVYYVDCDFESTSGQIITISGYGSVSADYETTITIMP